MEKLTPQNAEQEHLVQMLLAKLQGIDWRLSLTERPEDV